MSIERQQRDQDEYHLTCIHIAKESQTVRKRLGDKVYHFQEEIKRCRSPVINRVSEQTQGEINRTLHFDVVVHHKEKYAESHR